MPASVREAGALEQRCPVAPEVQAEERVVVGVLDQQRPLRVDRADDQGAAFGGGGQLGQQPLEVAESVVSTVVQMQVALPAAEEMNPTFLSAFETMMTGTPRIWLGGIVAYGVSTLLNVTIFTRLKASEGARLLWLRSGIASVLSQIVDTLIFITVAFYGVFPIGELLLGQMLAKVVLSAVLVPPLVYLFVALGRNLDARA